MVKQCKEAKIASLDRVAADSDSSENSNVEMEVTRVKRGPYKQYAKRPVKTAEQRKKARKAAQRRYKEKQKTDAARNLVQKQKEFAALCFGPQRKSKGRKQPALKEKLSAIEGENKELRAQLKELTKKKEARANKPNIKVSAARAELFNDAWRMLDYLSRQSNRLQNFRDVSADDPNDGWYPVRRWLRHNLHEMEKHLYDGYPTHQMSRIDKC